MIPHTVVTICCSQACAKMESRQLLKELRNDEIVRVSEGRVQTKDTLYIFLNKNNEPERIMGYRINELKTCDNEFADIINTPIYRCALTRMCV